MVHTEHTERFRIRSYSKTELGLLYTPHCGKEHAWRIMHRWITRCQPLNEALLATGITPSTRILSPRQVELIVEHLGEP